MNSIFSIIPTKIKFVLVALVGLIIITTIILALQPATEDKSQQGQIIPSQDTSIGKKITPDIEKKLNFVKKEASGEGKLIYTLDSQNPLRTDQIITQNEQVVFHRTYIPEDPSNPNHLLISAMVKKYGEPEKTFTGSKIWGPFIKTYLYNTKGFAFIGNPNTDEVYELQTFTPISIDQYVQSYGDDIDETPPEGES